MTNAFTDYMNKEAAMPGEPGAVQPNVGGNKPKAPNDNLNMHSESPVPIKGNEVYNAGRAPEIDITEKTKREGGPSLKSSRDYAAKVQNSQSVQDARNSGNKFNDLITWGYNGITGAKGDQRMVSMKEQNIKDAYAKEIEGEGLDKFNAKDRAAKLQTTYDAERAGGNLNAMNPSTALNKGSSSVNTGVNEGMKDIKQKTTDDYNKRIGDAVQKWGPWVAGLGLGGLGLFLALNQQGQPAQQINIQNTPDPDEWAKDKNWQGMQQTEGA